MEEAIELIRIHKTIVVDMKPQAQINEAPATRKANFKKINELGTRTMITVRSVVATVGEAERERVDLRLEPHKQWRKLSFTRQDGESLVARMLCRAADRTTPCVRSGGIVPRGESRQLTRRIAYIRLLVV